MVLSKFLHKTVTPGLYSVEEDVALDARAAERIS